MSDQGPEYRVEVEATYAGKGPIHVKVMATPAGRVIKDQVYASNAISRAWPQSRRYRLMHKGGAKFEGQIPNSGHPFCVLVEAEFRVNGDEETCIKRNIALVRHMPGTVPPESRTFAVQFQDPPPCKVVTGEDGTPWVRVRVKATPALNVVPDVVAIATKLNPPPEPTEPLTQDPNDPEIWEGWIPYPGTGAITFRAKAEFLVDAETSTVKRHTVTFTCPSQSCDSVR